ncbi:hypothetical protein [uncultured Corynebacterium sp.]|uniref:hypothetical protein n=1 Tax=uncultured Corynebacterium sp. TaxID=159447 RepID=UPI0025CED0CD|nr:hypothetical protein [uncultured Corynebacterium sp.]
MTTLDDLTPAERANLVGTWITVTHNLRPVIYTGEFESTGEIKHGAIIFDPLYGGNYARLDHCTPQFDLPRAWNPNGTPINSHWECAVGGQTLRPVSTSAVVTLVVPVKDLASINPGHPVTLNQPEENHQ